MAGFELVRSHLALEAGDYVQSFRAIELTAPVNKQDKSAVTRYERKIAAYMCCLHRAGFLPPKNFKVKFPGNATLNTLVTTSGNIDPTKGVALEQATTWWSAIWDVYDSDPYFDKYKKDKGHEWADEDLKAILTVLTRKRKSSDSPSLSGYTKLRDILGLHTSTVDMTCSPECPRS